MGGHRSTKIHLAGKDGYFKYLFGSFCFREAIPSRLRRFIEAVPGGEWSSSPIRCTSPFRNDNSPSRVVAKSEDPDKDSGSDDSDVVYADPGIGVALNNLLFLFRILLLYQQAAHCESFYSAVGKDLDDWPADVVEDTQRIFVEGRRLFLALPERLPPSHQHPRVRMLCRLVEQWEAVQSQSSQMSSVARPPPEEVQATWDSLRKLWQARYQSDPNSLLIDHDRYKLPPSQLLRLGLPEFPLSPTVEKMKQDEEATTILASIPLSTSATPVATSAVVRAWVDQLSRRAPESGKVLGAVILPPLKPLSPRAVPDRAGEKPDFGKVAPVNDRAGLDSSGAAQAAGLPKKPEKSGDPNPVRLNDQSADTHEAIEATKRAILLTISQMSALPRVPANPNDLHGSKKATRPSRPIAIEVDMGADIQPVPPIIGRTGQVTSVSSSPNITGLLKKPPKGPPAGQNIQGPGLSRKTDQLPEEPAPAALQLKQVPLQPPQPDSTASSTTKAVPEKVDKRQASGVPPVYKARRTGIDSRRRIENHNPTPAGLPKPPVRNLVGSLASAAIASALAPTLARKPAVPSFDSPIPVPSVIPVDSSDTVARDSSPGPHLGSPVLPKTPEKSWKIKCAQGNKTPEKKDTVTKAKEKQTVQKGQAVTKDSPGSQPKSILGITATKEKASPRGKSKTPGDKVGEKTAQEKHASPEKLSQKAAVAAALKTRANVHNDDETITDKSGDKCIALSQSRAKPSTPSRHAGSASSKDTTAGTAKPDSSRPPKSNARRLSVDSVEDARDRPRKRVSFGGTIYDKPEYVTTHKAVVGVSSLRKTSSALNQSEAPPRSSEPVISVHTEPVLISRGVRAYPTNPYSPAPPAREATSTRENLETRQAAAQGRPQETAADTHMTDTAPRLRPEAVVATMSAMVPFSQSSLQLAPVLGPDDEYDPLLADHRDARMMALLMAIKTQVDEQTHILRRLMLPESTDEIVRCHLEIVKSQMRSLSYASLMAYNKIHSQFQASRHPPPS